MNNGIGFRIKDWLIRESVKFDSFSVNSLLGDAIAVGSDLGKIRTDNQDRVVFAQIKSDVKSFFIGILSDGMGGMEDGADCAAITIASFIASFNDQSDLTLKKRVEIAVNKANLAVYDRYNNQGGATLSAFVVEGNEIVFTNVGDSRIYLVNDDHFYQLSSDDTLVAQLEAPGVQVNSPLLQYIGIGDGLEPHMYVDEVISGKHKIILTSDGLHHLECRQLEKMFKQRNITSLELCRQLLKISDWLDGGDNSSICIAEDIDTRLEVDKPNGLYLMSSHGNLEIVEITFDKNMPELIKDFNGTKESLKIEREKPNKVKRTETAKRKDKKSILQLRISYDE